MKLSSFLQSSAIVWVQHRKKSTSYQKNMVASTWMDGVYLYCACKVRRMSMYMYCVELLALLLPHVYIQHTQQRLERGKQATASGVYKVISQSIKQRLEKEAGTTLSMEKKCQDSKASCNPTSPRFQFMCLWFSVFAFSQLSFFCFTILCS